MHVHHRCRQGAVGVIPPQGSQDWQSNYATRRVLGAFNASKKCICGRCSSLNPTEGSLQHSLGPLASRKGLAAPSPRTSSPLSAFGLKFRPLGPQECPSHDKFLSSIWCTSYRAANARYLAQLTTLLYMIWLPWAHTNDVKVQSRVDDT